MERRGLLSRMFVSLAEAADRRFGWPQLPKPFGILTLIGLRTRLREQNLYDTGGPADLPAGAPGVPEAPVDHRTARTTDGTYNDLHFPLMGSLGSRFGRNVSIDCAAASSAAA